MRVAVQTLSQGVTVTKDNVYKASDRYSKLRAQALYTLYDLGFQSSPSDFDQSELYLALRQEYPNWFKLLMSSATGEVIAKPDMASYAIEKAATRGYSSYYSRDDYITFKKVVSAFRDYLIASDCLSRISGILSRYQFSKASERVIHSKIILSDGKVSNPSYGLCTEGVRECFKRTEGSSLRYIDTRSIVVKTLLELLNFSEEEISNQPSQKGYFISDFSQEQETKYIFRLLDGTIAPDGTYASRLIQALQSSFDKKEECIYNKVLTLSLPARCEAVSELRSQVKALGGRDFFVSDEQVIFEVPNNVVAKPRWYFGSDTIKVGFYAIDYGEMRPLSAINLLRGISGEFISEQEVFKRGYYTASAPVKLKVYAPSKKGVCAVDRNFYNISEVYYSGSKNAKGELTTKTLTPLIGTQVQLYFPKMSDVLSKLGINSVYSFYEQLIKNFTPRFNIDCKDYKSLIADLTCALLHSECGIANYRLSGGLYSTVTDDVFYSAAYEAELNLQELRGKGIFK